MTDIEQQAGKEAIGVAAWHGVIIEVCQVDEARPVNGDLVHRAIYIDEQGRRCTIWPKPSEVYLFKPSLMVGFSEEEIERMVLLADSEAFRRDDGELMMSGFGNGYFAGLRLANTRAVSIDKIIEVVREATWINDVDLLRERLMKIMP